MSETRHEGGHPATSKKMPMLTRYRASCVMLLFSPIIIGSSSAFLLLLRSTNTRVFSNHPWSAEPSSRSSPAAGSKRIQHYSLGQQQQNAKNSSTQRQKKQKTKKKHKTPKELDQLVSTLGLTPATSSKQTSKNNTSSNNNNQHRSASTFPKISLATQLQYARNGHAVLRQYLTNNNYSDRLHKIRQELLEYGSQQELVAWRQKVEVALSSSNNSSNKDSAKILASCHTVDDFARELQRLGIAWDRLPFLQYFNTWRELPNVQQMAYDLAETAAILLDVPSVRLYQDSFFWKRSHDGPTPWHTDARMAPFDTSNILTLWIPLHDVPKGGTALQFVSKSHTDFALPFWHGVSNENIPNSEWNRLDDRYQYHDIVNYMPLQLGDVTVHSGWTLHCADAPPTNDEDNGTSAQERLALAISYVDARAPVRDDVLSSSSYGDNEDLQSYQAWIQDVSSGQANFEHALVPIVWPPAKV